MSTLLRPRRWIRRLELARLRRMPRNVAGVTRLFGSPFRFLDAASFRAQYLDIITAEAFRFHPRGRPPRILDCGANVGVATAYFKGAFPEARITAFEPDPQVAAVFETNMASMGWTDVVLERAAVWSRAEALSFRQVASDAGRVSRQGDEGATQVTVPAVRLLDYLAEPVDLLKLDVEGAELEILGDLDGALDRVDHLFVEYHSFIGQPQRLGWMLSLLEKQRYRIHVLPGVTSARPFDRGVDHLGMDLQLNVFAWRNPT